MCWDADPSGSFDLDLRDPAQRLAYAERLPDRELERHWASTPHAVEIAFNSLGYREREFTPRVAGVRRIVVVGDSFTYGHGLPEALSYPRQLETLLRDAGERVEVLNLGVGGAELDRISRDAAFGLLELEADVLVYGYFLNDPRTEATRADVSPMLGVARAETRGSRFAIRMPGAGPSRLWDLLSSWLEQRRVTPATLAWYRELHRGKSWKDALSRLRELQRRAERRGARFVLVLLPIIWRLDGEYPLQEVHQHIVRATGQRGIEVIDVLPELRGRPDPELFIHPRDRHPNAEYARVVAETLARALRQ